MAHGLLETHATRQLSNVFQQLQLQQMLYVRPKFEIRSRVFHRTVTLYWYFVLRVWYGTVRQEVLLLSLPLKDDAEDTVPQ